MTEEKQVSPFEPLSCEIKGWDFSYFVGVVIIFVYKTTVENG